MLLAFIRSHSRMPELNVENEIIHVKMTRTDYIMYHKHAAIDQLTIDTDMNK